MNQHRAVLAAPILTALALPLLAETKIPRTDFKGQPAHKVITLIGADTIVVSIDGKLTKLCLLGVDAPGPDQRHGKESAQFLDNLLTGESVYVEFEPKTEPDKDGRMPAWVYRAPDGFFVNGEMIRQGYARAAKDAPTHCKLLLSEYQAKAKEARKGIWAGTDVAVVQDRRRGGPQ